MNGYEMYEKLLEELGAETLLNDLVCALSEDEKKENFEYIARMRDIELQSNDELCSLTGF